ncbi:hypothetical protein K7G98_03140 [Saccharothrix sp. MB29]|nr:hypothetical protein [Saccharothrix sp. MB29]
MDRPGSEPERGEPCDLTPPEAITDVEHLRAVALTLAVPPRRSWPPHASADPGICIGRHGQGVEATDACWRLQDRQERSSGDVRRCRSILQAEGVPPGEARHACRIASYPED